VTTRQAQLRIGAGGGLVAALVLLPFVSLSGANRGQINFYSTDDDRRLGADAARALRAANPLVSDPAASAYLQRLGASLASATGAAWPAWEFRLVDSPAVHAFALPGGFVYVTRGLVLGVRDEAQLAGVIAHELAHVVLRHGTQQLSREELLTIFSTLGDAVLVGLLYPHRRPSEMMTLDRLSYSRADETEADDLAVRFLRAARYDPEALAAFFDRLRGLRQESRFTQFLSTHPPSARRARRLRERIATLPRDAGPASMRDSPAFREIQERLRVDPAAPR
jgi:predicted Zn-dependent protease